MRTKRKSDRRRELERLEAGWASLYEETRRAISPTCQGAPPGTPDPVATAAAKAVDGLRLIRHAISQLAE